MRFLLRHNVVKVKGKRCVERPQLFLWPEIHEGKWGGGLTNVSQVKFKKFNSRLKMLTGIKTEAHQATAEKTELQSSLVDMPGSVRLIFFL